MTPEPVTVVRAFLDHVATWDLARMHDGLDPDVVWFGTRGGLDENAVLRGPDAVLAYIGEIREPWESYAVESVRLIEVGATVVVFLHETGHARGGGLELQNDTAMVIKVRGDNIAEATGYLDRDEALRAAGPAE